MTNRLLLGSPIERLLDALRAHGREPRQRSDGWQCQCPAHDDRDPSLSIDQADDGKVLLKCHAGCRAEAVVAAVGLTLADLYADSGNYQGNGAHPLNDRPAVNWSVYQAEYRAAFDGMRDDLVEVLGVPGPALDEVGYGWCEREGCFTTAERDGSGNVVGINRRFHDGRKIQETGGRRGLIVPDGFAGMSGPILILEGASCTAAAIAAGLCAVGRPNHIGGADQLATLLRSVEVGRALVIVGENDQKADGSWPGRDGATQVAEKLAAALSRPVRWALIPDGVKDARAWLCSRVGAEGTADQWTAAGADLVRKLLATARTVGERRGWQWDLISSVEFAGGDFRPTWVVKRLLVADEPIVIGGAEKTLKTTIAADLAVSIATATPFLGYFHVYKRRRVALISGESGRHAMQGAFLRICKARDDLDPERCDVLWGFTLPAFPDPNDMAELRRKAADNGVEFVVIDPAYLATLKGADPNDAKSLFAMGMHLARFAEAVIQARATPAVVHHANKTTPGRGPMQLTDLSYSGFSHYAAQWLLFSREGDYLGDGRHELRLNAGGRQGQGGQWALTIDEGVMAEDFTGRKWNVQVEPYRDHRQRAAEERESERDRRKRGRVEKDAADLLVKWGEQENRTATKGHMRGVMGGWSGDRINFAVAFLMDRRKLFPSEVEVKSGRDGAKTSTVAGYVAVRASEGSDGKGG
jgi:AAA domain